MKLVIWGRSQDTACDTQAKPTFHVSTHVHLYGCWPPLGLIITYSASCWMTHSLVPTIQLLFNTVSWYVLLSLFHDMCCYQVCSLLCTVTWFWVGWFSFPCFLVLMKQQNARATTKTNSQKGDCLFQQVMGYGTMEQRVAGDIGCGVSVV